MIRMAVCMKQVPGDIGSSLSADGRICRDASAMTNPADVFSLETALTLKEQYTGQVDIFTMGTEAARTILKESAALGADGLIRTLPERILTLRLLFLLRHCEKQQITS